MFGDRNDGRKSMSVAGTDKKREAIFILGMHRSGTSALTRVLNLLGVSISSDLWPADSANKKGFWEDPRVFGIHDTMLASLGRNWHDLRDLPSNWLDSDAAAKACDELVELLRSEFSASSLWMVKDPRMCRLMPLWHRVITRLNVSPYFVLALRHPNEVAESLSARNAHSHAQTRLAWLEHTAEAVLGSKSYPRTVVSYDQLMEDWETSVKRIERELGIRWPVDLGHIATQVEDFLTPGERHHRISELNDKSSDLVELLYSGLARAARGLGWQEADDAAAEYSVSRHAFLGAMASREEEFQTQHGRWQQELQVLKNHWSDDFTNKLISSAKQELTQTLAAGGWFRQAIEPIEQRLEARMDAQIDAVAILHGKIDRLIHDNQESVNKLVGDLKQEMDASRIVTDRLHHAQSELVALRGSTSWRVTAPFRFVSSSLRAPRAFCARVRYLSGLVAATSREHGLRVALRKIVNAPRRHGMRALLKGTVGGASFNPVQSSDTPAPLYTLPRAFPAQNRLALRVLIIAELAIPQCRKYRVNQKQQMISELGIDCTVVSWSDFQKCRNLLQTHSVAIFYRVPGFPEPLRIIREAKALGLVTFWEVDDLIFDVEKYAGNSNLADLNDETRRGVIEGVPLYRAAMLECDYGIASTQGLADAMREAGVGEVFVVENALDKETVRAATKVSDKRKHQDGIVRIVYGSGTKTHDADFRVAAPAIKRVLLARPNVHLVVIGELNLPVDYSDIRGQLERLPLSDYPIYLERLAACNINIAPLENSVFNDSKSNIKFLEASIVGLPSVCSPSAAFRAAINPGNNGFLPEDDRAWERDLLALIDDAGLRASVAQRAHDYVAAHYVPSTVAVEQVAPILEPYKHTREKLRVLGVNIYYSPRSFGGATIVAEEVAKYLNRGEEAEYAMFTTLPVSEVPGYEVVRYSAAGGDVFAMGLPPEGNALFDFENPNVVAAFTETLHALRPDIVHLHCIQGIGASIAEICQREGIPYAITLHDAWWICGRQFMITGESKYCYQRKIDLDVCATCVVDANKNAYRQHKLREVLLSASCLITPSSFFRQLHIDNGFDPEHVVVNKNGVLPPKRLMQRVALQGRPLRFGYVGGETSIKGAHLIRKAFSELPYSNYELYVVDNMLNYGHHSIDAVRWGMPGVLKIIPAYTQETIDDFFEGIDVLLFPTQWKESFGLSVREALLRDVWVIATDAGGVVEDIVDGENGDIISLKDDGSELAAAIARLLESPARLNGFVNPHANRIRVFSDQADELLSLFRELTSGAGASASHGVELGGVL
jgi:glycosyltransferase involved in cell wall biosynthesis